MIRRCISCASILSATIGVSLSLIVFFVAELQKMEWWNATTFLINVSVCCIFIQLGVVLLFLILRLWGQAVKSIAMLSILFLSVAMSVLTAGPDIENVMQQTADRIGVQPSDLVCRNGRLARESSVVFELKEGALLRSNFDKVSPDADVVRLLIETLSTAHVEAFSAENIEIRRFRMEFNTVFTVSTSDRTYVIFYGNAVH